MNKRFGGVRYIVVEKCIFADLSLRCAHVSAKCIHVNE